MIRRLLKNTLKPRQKQECGAFQKSVPSSWRPWQTSWIFMKTYDPKRPVVCLDEGPKQLIAEVREPIPVEPGAPARYDTEYERKGVCDLMIICEPKQGFHQLEITDRRTKTEFAHSMKQIADQYPDASVIREVLDDLNTHKMVSLYEAFPAERAQLGTQAGVPLYLPSTAVS
jgi:hypothetical protein